MSFALLDKHIISDFTSLCSSTVLWFMFRGDTSIVQLLVEKLQLDPDEQHGRDCNSALHLAARAGKLLWCQLFPSFCSNLQRDEYCLMQIISNVDS